MKIKDNTILRIKVPAHLYESIKAQLTINEAKGKRNLGAGMEVVKEKKAPSDKPKATKAKSAVPKKAEGAKEAPKDGHKKMGLEELKALAEMLQTQIAEMEKHEGGEKEKMEEVEKIGKRNFTYTDADGTTKYVTADDLDKARELAKKFGGDENSVRAADPKTYEEKDLTKEWNPDEPDEPSEINPRDYEPDYMRQGGRSFSRRDVKRMRTGLYSDDELADLRRADAIRAGRISPPKQTPGGDI